MTTRSTLTAVLAFFLTQRVCTADVISVRKDSKGDLTRVQEALDFSEPGDVIEIADDEKYVEDIDLRSYPFRTIRAVEGKRPTINGNIIMGNKCVLEGLTIEPLEYEFWGSIRCDRLPDGCVIRNCRISGAKAVGLRGSNRGERPVLITVFWASKGVQITGNELAGGAYALFLDSEPQDTVIAGNLIRDCANGIRFQLRPKDTVVEGNTFVRCGRALVDPTAEGVKRLRHNIFAFNSKAITGQAARGLDENLFWKNGSDYEGNISKSPTDSVADPSFQDSQKGDFHLKDQQKWPKLGAYGKREPVPSPSWEAFPTTAKTQRKDYRALHAKYGWLQEKIDQLPPEGGTIDIPAGVHELRSTLVVNDRRNVTLRGQGMDKTKIAMLANVRFLSAKRCQGLSVEQLTTDGGAAQGMYCYEVADSRVSHVRFTGVYWDCCSRSSISDNEIAGSLWLTHCKDIQISGNTVASDGSAHIIDLNGGNSGCDITNNRFSGGYPIHVYYSASNTITDNLFIRMRGAINIHGGGDTLFARNVIREGTARPAIELAWKGNDTSPGVRILSNIVHGNQSDAVRGFVDQPTPDHPQVKNALNRPTLIEGNVIVGNAGAGIDWTEPSKHHYDNPVVRHNIVVSNQGAGIGGSGVQASYNNVWRNSAGDHKDCEAGPGTMSADPLFADPDQGDFHLKSRAGRWEPRSKSWVKDDVHSPCIDAGDPKAEHQNEPGPNGGRLNLGAYGNIPEASKSTKRP